MSFCQTSIVRELLNGAALNETRVDMAVSPDIHNLDRFLQAQREIYRQALRELISGRKRSHWMWFIFPQIDGLGSSPMSRRYAIQSSEEADAYLAHPVLGPRLHECVDAIMASGERSANAILGYPDDLKFRSCITLFREVGSPGSLFDQAIQYFFDGKPDEETLIRLQLGGKRRSGL